MGLVLWGGAAMAAVVLTRFLRIGHAHRWLPEAGVAFVAATLCGLAATALDFGGWREPDPRAGAFVFLGSLAAIGFFRTIRPRP